MKKIIIGLVLSLSTSLMANGTTAQTQDGVKNYNTEHVEQFFYKKGMVDGTKLGYKQGYAEALEFAKKQLRLYAQKIKAYESGKYLKEHEGKITNPEIYQIKNGNEIKVIVRGCRIEKQLTPDEIINLPHYPIDGVGNPSFSYTNMDESNAPLFGESIPTDSADIIARDGNGFYGDRGSNPYLNDGSYYYLENSQAMRKQLSVLNYTYAIEDNKIKVIFSNENEKKSFMEKMGY